MSLLAAIGGLITTAISTVGPVIAKAATTLVTKLPTIIEVAKVTIGAISTVVSKVSEVLGIAPADEKVDELGAKAMQEGTRAKMDEESTQEYLDYLRNDVELDTEKFDKMSEKEKIECEALGTSMLSKSIEEKTGVELPVDFLMTIPRMKLDYKQVEKFIDAFSENNIESMGEFTKYISNEMSDKEAEKVGDVVEGALKELSPEMTDEDIQSEIVSMKKEYFSNEE